MYLIFTEFSYVVWFFLCSLVLLICLVHRSECTNPLNGNDIFLMSVIALFNIKCNDLWKYFCLNTNYHSKMSTF